MSAVCDLWLSVQALWTSSGACLVYPSHAVVVAMQVSNGQQRFFIGHTDKVGIQSFKTKVTMWIKSLDCSRFAVKGSFCIFRRRN